MAIRVLQVTLEELKDIAETYHEMLQVADREGLKESIDLDLLHREVLEQRNERSNVNTDGTDNIQAMAKAEASNYRMREEIKEEIKGKHRPELWAEAKEEIKEKYGPEIWAEAKDETKEEDREELMEAAQAEVKDENFDIIYSKVEAQIKDEYEGGIKERLHEEHFWRAGGRHFFSRVASRSRNPSENVVNENADKSTSDARKRSRSVAESTSIDCAHQEVSVPSRPVVKKRKILE